MCNKIRGGGSDNPLFLTPGPGETFLEVPEIYAKALVSKQGLYTRNSYRLKGLSTEKSTLDF